MASNTDLALRIAAIYDASGMNKADKSVKGFEKTLKKLGKTLGITLSAAAIVKFGKDSAKAFIEDEKQAKRLSIAVKNLGLQFYDANITDFIDRLTIASGVADDQLRPALQKLLTTTGDVTKSQQLLKQAIDISAGSGVDLATVSQDLANAYVGNTKGLKKYYLGLSQTQLKAMSFADIQAKLNKQFAGANQQYLQTYAGQMSILTVAAGEAQEVIGGALIQSLMDFTGAVDAADLAEKIGGWSQALAKFIGDFTWGLKKLWFMTSDRALLESINPFSNYIEKGLAKIDAERAAAEWKRAIAGAMPYDPTNNAVTGFQRDKKAAADAAKRAKENARLLAKNTAELKKQTALKKAGTLFDMEQIQIIAALKGKISADDRKRLELQLALATENLDEVSRLSKELALSQGLGKELAAFLADLPSAKNPFEAWKTFLDGIESQAARIANMQFNVSAGMANFQYTLPTGNFTYGQGNPLNTSVFVQPQQPSAPSTVVVNVAGSVTTSQNLIDEIRGGLNVAALSGSSANVERRIGGW
jgi:hypothetical protein